MLRTWSTTTRVSSPTCENSLSSSCSELATGRLAATSPSRVSMQAQWEAFPTSNPRTALLAGAALSAMASSNRRSIGSRFPRHPHHPAVDILPEVRQFPTSRLKRRRPRRQHLPGPLRDRGGRPYAGARSAAQTGLPASYPTPGKCINGVLNSSSLAVMGKKVVHFWKNHSPSIRAEHHYRGRRMVKRLPTPSTEVTSMTPPWLSTIHLAMASPRPEPCAPASRALSAR